MTRHPWRLWVAVLVAAGLLVGATVTYSPYRPTGPVVFQPGSVTVPQITGTTSLFSGFFWPVANHLGLTISGHEAVRFHATALTLHHTAAIRFAHSGAQMHGGQRGHITALRMSTVGASSSVDPDGNDQLVVGHASTVLRLEAVGGGGAGGEIVRFHGTGLMFAATGSADIGMASGSRPRFVHATAFLALDGSAAAPAYAFGVQATTGMFFPATAAVGWTIAGQEVLRLHAGGLMASVNNSFDIGTGAGSRFRHLHLTGGITLNGAIAWLQDNVSDLGTNPTSGRIRDAFLARDLHVTGFVHVQGALTYGLHVVVIGNNTVGASANGEILAGIRSAYGVECNDPDGCNVFLAETGVSVGQIVRVINIGVNSLTITDGGSPPTGASVLHLAGTMTTATSQTMTLMYVVNRSGDGNWYELSRSAN